MPLMQTRFTLRRVPQPERRSEMARWKSSCPQARLAVAGTLVWVGASMLAPRPAVGAGSIVRTMVYHEFTSLTTPFSDNPVLSADGSRAAFTVAPGTGDPATPNRIYVVNTDGTGLREVDAY